MTAQPPVLSYAVRRPTQPGLTPGVLMAIFALAQCATSVFGFYRLLGLIGRVPLQAFFGLGLIVQLIPTLLTGVGVVLVITRVGFGRWFLFCLFVYSLLVAPGFYLIARVAGASVFPGYGEWWKALSLGNKAAVLSSDLLTTLSSCVLLWLLWTLAKAADKHLSAADIPWWQIGRVLHICILATGVCGLLSTVVVVLQRSLERGFNITPSEIVNCVAAAALIRAAASALQRQRWAWLACTAALVLVWLQPLIGYWLPEMASGHFSMMWSDRRLTFLLLVVGAALPLLLILLVLHPCIRQASRESDGRAAG